MFNNKQTEKHTTFFKTNLGSITLINAFKNIFFSYIFHVLSLTILL